jgi:hypothetical protein
VTRQSSPLTVTSVAELAVANVRPATANDMAMSFIGQSRP